MLDFEQPAIQAFTSMFPSESIVCCSFHFLKCLWRCVQSQLLGPQYMSDDELSHQVKMIAALAYVPVEHVSAVFCVLKGRLDARLTGVISYFERNFVGWICVNRVTSPVYAHTTWNLVVRVLEGLPRTNNLVEGWHNLLRRIVGSSRPTLKQFFKKLRLMQHTGYIERMGGLRHSAHGVKRTLYEQVSMRLRNLVENFSAYDPLEYLSKIAGVLRINHL